MLSETLLASIYAIATEQQAFGDISGVIASELGYGHGLISISSGGGPVELAMTQAPEVMQGYLDYYHKLDPWAGVAARTRYGEAIVTDIEQRQQFYDTEFYVDFAFQIGMVDPLGVRMPLGKGTELLVGLNQALRSTHPTPEDEQIMLVIGRHLQRAVQLRQQLSGVVGDRGTLLAALDRVAFGMAITTADGRVQALNKAGEGAIASGCGLLVRKGFLTAQDGSMAGALALLIRDASNGGSGGALRLRAGLDSFANVLVAPLPPNSDWPGSGSRTLVAFRLSGAPTHLNAHLLISTFGLSRGEAQVAVALTEGKSGEEIALARGVKTTTIKSQLQSIFIKTGTSSQRELVGFLAALPAVVVD
ncbi:helix-turn-helix transcriptional regulator [Devosia rhizoryzae]|uniref:HTH luxR-type domain-containing protein n=1 Tax=Devosia rhizoryzae TaxID=2774137 RepID=A0ABX7C222_9HYPH|nr:LuxR C-terminal-related transcriptional regulator [Devosia rhizoryzae]QQR38280.1 hypothetical protein JI748_10845 [Devosia rhizoryzae]